MTTSTSDIRPFYSEPFVLDLGDLETFTFGLDLIAPLLETEQETIRPY